MPDITKIHTQDGQDCNVKDAQARNQLQQKVPVTRQINSHALSDDITLTKTDIGLDKVDNSADSDKDVRSAGNVRDAEDQQYITISRNSAVAEPQKIATWDNSINKIGYALAEDVSVGKASSADNSAKLGDASPDTAATNDTIVKRTSTGDINAKTFYGNLNGKATSAGSADSAQTITETLTVDKGGTGAKTAESARTNLGLGDSSIRNIAQANENTWASTVVGVSETGRSDVGQMIKFHPSKDAVKNSDPSITARNDGLTLSGTTNGTFKGDVDGLAARASLLEQNAVAMTVGNADQPVYFKDGIPVGGTNATVDPTASKLVKRSDNGAIYASEFHGERRYYETKIDLSNTGTYDVGTYYPVIGSEIPKALGNDGYHFFRGCSRQDYSGNPSWASNGFRSDDEVYQLPDSAQFIRIIWVCSTNDMPCSYNVSGAKTGGRYPIFWCRGGGIYYLYADYSGCEWNIVTTTYTTDGNETFAPRSSVPGSSYAQTFIKAWTLRGYSPDAGNPSTGTNKNSVALRRSDSSLMASYFWMNKAAEYPTTTKYVMTATENGVLNRSNVTDVKNMLGFAKTVATTLDKNGWSQGTEPPYTYDLGTEYQDQIVLLNIDSDNATSAQFEVMQAALIQGGSTTKLYAWGDRPTEDIPVILVYQPITASGGTSS